MARILLLNWAGVGLCGRENHQSFDTAELLADVLLSKIKKLSHMI